MTDGTEATETGGMEGIARITREETTDGIVTLNVRIGKILSEKKITEARQDDHETRKIYTIVQPQLPSPLYPRQNKRIKGVREIVMNILSTNRENMKTIPGARPHNHNHRLDQISM